MLVNFVALLMVTAYPFLETYQVVHIEYAHIFMSILSQLKFKTTNLKTSTEINKASIYKFSFPIAN